MDVKTPIRINKSFGFSEVDANEESAIPYIKVKGYASRMYDDTGSYVIDADSENIDTMGIDLSRLKDGSLPLLYGHDQNKPVGKITGAEYLADGLVIEATLYKLPGDEMTNFVYQSVKAGVLNSFSVGILVKDFDIIEKDGQDYLQLKKSEMIETSIVAVPSNPKATFGILEVKSADSDEVSYKTIISKSVLKAENPNACSEFEQCVLATKEVNVEEKGLTYEDTAKESWVKSQEFYKSLDILQSTIQDNWYSEQYWEEISPQEALINVKGTLESFVREFEKLIMSDEDCADKNLKGKEMATKNTEEVPVVETPVTETPEVEPTQAETPIETKEEIPEEIVEETPGILIELEEVERTVTDLLVEVSGLGPKMDSISPEDVEKIYNTFMGVTDIIEDLVAASVKEELEEANPAA